MQQSIEYNRANDLTAGRVDPEFKHRLKKSFNGETLKYCYQCGTCSSVCPISKFIKTYRPNKMIELAKLGIRNLPQSNAFLFCSACTLCTKGCPQGVMVHEVMQALKDNAVNDEVVLKFVNEEFLGMVKALGKEIPLPVVYSWISLRPTAEKDAQGFEAAIMNALMDALEEEAVKAEIAPDAKKIAVIGSGPAGLTAAWNLAKTGYAVTIFESLSEAGGMLRTGIPEYRLPKTVVAKEIDRIVKTGVDIKLNSKVDGDFFESLVKGDEYIAVFIASGAYASRKIRVEGEELQNVVPALKVLEEYNMTGKVTVGDNVVVIGGGNVATDAAGAALRSGAKSVKLYCLEDRKTMPAHEWEIEEIAHDGVELNPSWGPRAILGDGEKVTSVEFMRCKSVFDENKRFNPVYDEKVIETVEADTVITAIGQGPDLSFLGEGINVFRGAVAIDKYTMETSLAGVFAGGDAAAGTASLVEAITAGKTAADSIKKYINGLEKE